MSCYIIAPKSFWDTVPANREAPCGRKRFLDKPLDLSGIETSENYGASVAKVLRTPGLILLGYTRNVVQLLISKEG